MRQTVLRGKPRPRTIATGRLALANNQDVRTEFDQDLADLTLPTLCRKYANEASVHRNILMSRGTGVTGTWRDFRCFLGDIGPRPTPDHGLVLLNRNERTYGPGRARWMTPDYFRFGASSLLNDVLMQIEKERTGRYQGPDHFTLD